VEIVAVAGGEDLVGNFVGDMGNNLDGLTEKPRAFRMVPKDAAVMPLPSPERTPPVTKMYLVWLPFAISLRTAPFHHQTSRPRVGELV
jgi:hypothetical protein